MVVKPFPTPLPTSPSCSNPAASGGVVYHDQGHWASHWVQGQAHWGRWTGCDLFITSLSTWLSVFVPWDPTARSSVSSSIKHCSGALEGCGLCPDAFALSGCLVWLTTFHFCFAVTALGRLVCSMVKYDPQYRFSHCTRRKWAHIFNLFILFKIYSINTYSAFNCVLRGCSRH